MYMFRIVFQLIILINYKQRLSSIVDRMYKATSLNQIYQTSSFGSNTYLPPTHAPKNSYTLIHDQQGHVQRRYEISSIEFSRECHLIEWRKKIHHPIPKISHVKHCTDHNQKNYVSLLCQHINLYFTDLRLLKVQQIMYCLSEMLLGYQEIYARLGFVCIQPQFIGLNKNGELLIWINENLSVHVAQYRKLISQKQIVTKIIQILQTKAYDKNHAFFVQLKKLQSKFKSVLDFIMTFKNKHKLKIIPKIKYQKNVTPSNDSIQTSSIIQNKTEKQLKGSSTNVKNSFMNSSGLIKSSHSEQHFLAGSKINSNQCSNLRNNVSNRSSIMQNNLVNTPTSNLNNSVYDKSAPKINFSYSQKRGEIFTPKQSGFIRDYTSDKNLPILNKICSETNHIKEFTLDDRKSNAEIVEKPKRRSKYDRNIVQSYTIHYVPQNDTMYMQTQLDLKRSSLSHFSQSSFSQKDRLFGRDTCQNKTSMTTNHRSAVTQSFQSIGKSSNDDEYYNRKNDLFTSNNSHRTTYSIIKNSFVENEHSKNAVSFVVGNSHEFHAPPSPLNRNFRNLQTSLNNEKQKDMYTFGGLIKTSEQQPKVTKFTQIQQAQNVQKQQGKTLQQKGSLSNQIHTKSIEELYNNLYFNSQKKSMILDEGIYQVKLSPVKEEISSHVKESFVLDLNPTMHQPISHTKPKSDRSNHEFLTPKINDNQQAFNYNQWRGIKGLLNESNVYQLKESIHCGPEIRTPVNIKLQLLDKFGREIGQSILPSTPSMGHHSRAHSIYTEEHSYEHY